MLSKKLKTSGESVIDFVKMNDVAVDHTEMS